MIFFLLHVRLRSAVIPLSERWSVVFKSHILLGSLCVIFFSLWIHSPSAHVCVLKDV